MPKSQLYSIAFGLSLLILLIFSVLLYDSINSLRDKSFLVEHSQIIIDKLQTLNLAMMDVETSQRGFLLTRDTSFLDLLIQSRDKIPVLLDTLTVLTGNNQSQAKNAVAIKEAVVMRLLELQEVLNRMEYYSIPELTAELKSGKKLMDLFRHKISVMQKEESSLLNSQANSKHAYERLTPNYFKAILTITTMIGLASFILLLRELKQRLAVQSLLETRVNTLGQANAELQQIAHITSHDLQEPLRKIRTFIDALQSKFPNDLPDEAKVMLERVDKNANYIRELVADLSDFVGLANNEEDRLPDVDVNKILFNVQKEQSAAMALKQAQIQISALPRVSGFEKQMHILFRELFTNALKFSKPGHPLEITITGNLVTGKQLPQDFKFGDRNFNVISIYDNGIGFDEQYAHKIFILFQRLHGSNSSYKGKGIGLAICQRIMANHDGFITAAGQEGKGATFQLYFPIDH